MIKCERCGKKLKIGDRELDIKDYIIIYDNWDKKYKANGLARITDINKDRTINVVMYFGGEYKEHISAKKVICQECMEEK